MLLKLYNKNNDPRDLQRIVDILADGGIVIYPTDTMYAIGCHALKERAVERICKLKKHRSDEKPSLHHLLRPQLHQRVCPYLNTGIQTDEAQLARTVHIHPARFEQTAKNFPQSPRTGSRNPYAGSSSLARNSSPA